MSPRNDDCMIQNGKQLKLLVRNFEDKYKNDWDMKIKEE